MTNNLDFFEVIDQTKTDKIFIADGTVIDADGVGDGYLNCTLDDGTIHRIKVENVLYVPILTGSLLSVKKLTSKGNTVEFTDNQCFIRMNEKLLAVERLENSLYKLLCKHKIEMANVAKSEINYQNCIHMWQRRSGHRNPNAVKRIDKEGLATGIHIDECSVIIKCEHCVKGKATHKPYPESSTHHTKQPLDLIDSDVCESMKTLRTLLTVAVSKKMQVNHYDVKTAFLNGDIKEELYMNQKEGFAKPDEEQKVCKLKKALYGLKQSTRSWNQKIDSVLKVYGFKQSEADLCLYTKQCNGALLYVLLYVDDLLMWK